MTTNKDITASTFRDYIDLRAAHTPQKPYYISADEGYVLTYAELQSQCKGLGGQFQTMGYQHGDKISVYMPNCQAATVILLSIMANGLVANPINLLAQASQLRHILWHSDTRLVITTQELAATIQPVLSEIDRHIDLVVVDSQAKGLPRIAHSVDGNTVTNGAGTDEMDSSEIGPDSPALLMYTSGTTGVPKGVVLTHANLISNARTISAEHKLTAADRVLGSLPLFHINGLVVTVLTPLVHGGSVAMTPRFSVASFWDHVKQYECTWINGVPTIIAYLLNDASTQQAADLKGVRFCRTASAALSPDHLTAFQKRFGIGIIETMGLTETAAPAFSNPYDPEQRRLGSVGRPSGTKAKVIDEHGVELGDNEHGEIVLSGSNIMREYYKDPERTAEAFTADGWLRTGDIGYRDKDGFYYIIGRAKELIIKGGENIAPREIDEAVVKHSSVLDAAAVGIPHPDYGQDIAVYLVLREDAVFDDKALRDHCLAELGKYKSPSKFVVVDELPRGPSGKVQRLKLLEL